MSTQAINDSGQAEDLSWMQRLSEEEREQRWDNAFGSNNREEIELLFRAKVPPFNSNSREWRFGERVGTLETAIVHATTTESDVRRLLDLKAVPLQFLGVDHRDALNVSLTRKEYTDAVAMALINAGAKVLLPIATAETVKWGSLDLAVIGRRNIETLRRLIDVKAQATLETIKLTQGKNYSAEALRLLQAARIDISEQEKDEIIKGLDREPPTAPAVQSAAVAANPPIPEASTASSVSREEAPQNASRFCACLDGVLPESLVDVFEAICGWIAGLYNAFVRHFEPVERNSN